jgi:hypothetical protein
VSSIFYSTLELLRAAELGPSRIREGHGVVYEDC